MSSQAPPLLPRQTYREGQLLGVDAFEREQAFHAGLREYQTRQLFTPGVLAGLEVTAAPATAPAKGWVLTVSPGAALDSAGRLILLVDRLRFVEGDVSIVDGKATVGAVRDVPIVDGKATVAIVEARSASWQVIVASGEADGEDRKLPQPVIALTEKAPGPDQVVLARLKVSASAAVPPVVTVERGDGEAARATLAPGRLPPIDAAGLTGTLPADKVAGMDAARLVGLISPGQLQPLPAETILGWAELLGRVEALEARFPALPEGDPTRPRLKGALLGGATFLGTRFDMAMLTNSGFTVQALVRPARLQGELPLMSAVFPLIDSPTVAAAVLPGTPASLALSLLDGQVQLRFMSRRQDGFAMRTLTGRHTLLPGLWALITLALGEDGSARLYIDGVETASLPAGDAAVLGEMLLLATDGRQQFRGEAAWFALWTGTRSADQVAATPDRFLTLREVESGRVDGLAAYWELVRGQQPEVKNLADARAWARLAPSSKLPAAWAEEAEDGATPG